MVDSGSNDNQRDSIWTWTWDPRSRQARELGKSQLVSAGRGGTPTLPKALSLASISSFRLNEKKERDGNILTFI